MEAVRQKSWLRKASWAAVAAFGAKGLCWLALGWFALK